MRKSKTWIATSTDRELYDDLKAHARSMRKKPTPAEKVLWLELRHKQVRGYRFRRQHPIDRFVVDFYCREARLVIEVDGSIHDSPEAIDYDEARQRFLEDRGLHLLRFSNEQVIRETARVFEVIEDYLSRLQSATS